MRAGRKREHFELEVTWCLELGPQTGCPEGSVVGLPRRIRARLGAGSSRPWRQRPSFLSMGHGTSSRAVEVASVVRPVDLDNPLAFVDPVDDPILPDPGAAPAGALAPESVAYLLRVGDQTAEAELDDGGDDARRLRGKTIERSSRRWRPTQLIVVHETSGREPPPWSVRRSHPTGGRL